jgi:hypothetical protein
VKNWGALRSRYRRLEPSDLVDFSPLEAYENLDEVRREVERIERGRGRPVRAEIPPRGAPQALVQRVRVARPGFLRGKRRRSA